MTKKKLYGKSRTVPVLKTNLEILSWIKRGKLRKLVFANIDKRTMPSEIVDKLVGKEKRKSESHYAQVSRAIAELETQKLIKCLNPKEKTGRLYQLTKKGLQINKLLGKNNLFPISL